MATASKTNKSAVEKAKSRASVAANALADEAAATAKAAKRSAYRAADGVTDKAANLADDAIATGRAEMDRYAERGKGQTEDLIRTVSRAIDASSQSLENDGMHATASYVRAAANGLERAADEVDGFNTGDLTGRVENFVRNQPMLVVGGLALAGFLFAGSLSKKRRS